MFRKVSVVIGFVMMASVGAADAGESMRVYMNYGCGAYVDARRSDTQLSNFLEAWIGGWISGINRKLPSGDILNGSSLKGAYILFDNYCQQNPLDMLSTAAIRITNELESKQQSSK